ncbi:AAA family ATPase [Candidatus Neptunochlamydia vexilliferae]|nr:ATP-binding protein [Candidatus Neptunochlamydia vexilliferae]
MADFIGRQGELKDLQTLLKKDGASLVVLRGRRRVGKSRLIEEFTFNLPTISFAGIPPTKNTTAQSQREEFSRQMQYELKIKKPQADDWGALFRELVDLNQERPIVVVLDEISWVGSKDPDFLGKLKLAWDRGFSKNKKLILILCGSVSSWIEENILSSTGFVGRITLSMHLKPLSLSNSCEFWASQGDRVSPYEIFKVLSVTGGVPRYLEEILPSETAEENIHRLCFKESGLLFNEFDQIFNDLFSARSTVCKNILLHMSDRSLFLKDVYEALNVQPSGAYAEHVDDLVKAGFVSRDYTWDLKTGKESNLSRFRVSDNYIRFYLKAILPNKKSILAGTYNASSIVHREGWKSLLGLQFETLVLNNVNELYKHLNIPPGDVQRAGPFFQRKSLKNRGCQIDLLIQTYHRVLYLVEIKFSQNEITNDVKSEVQRKIDALSLPKGFSVKPVLIHVNGVCGSVYPDRFFAHIVDFSDLLKKG